MVDTTLFGTPVLEHWLKWEITQWVHHLCVTVIYYKMHGSKCFCVGRENVGEVCLCVLLLQLCTIKYNVCVTGSICHTYAQQTNCLFGFVWVNDVCFSMCGLVKNQVYYMYNNMLWLNVTSLDFYFIMCTSRDVFIEKWVSDRSLDFVVGRWQNLKVELHLKETWVFCWYYLFQIS